MLLGLKLIKETKKFPYEMFKKNQKTNQTKHGTPPTKFHQFWNSISRHN